MCPNNLVQTVSHLTAPWERGWCPDGAHVQLQVTLEGPVKGSIPGSIVRLSTTPPRQAHSHLDNATFLRGCIKLYETSRFVYLQQ